MNGQNRRRRLIPDEYDREQYAADPWKNLALAIVQQALTDYLTALKAGNGGSITALERFFSVGLVCTPVRRRRGPRHQPGASDRREAEKAELNVADVADKRRVGNTSATPKNRATKPFLALLLPMLPIKSEKSIFYGIYNIAQWEKR